MKKNTTLTIGIPAYNEENNIFSLLQQVISQKYNNVTLEKIIVYSDGSKDLTVKNSRKIKLNKLKIVDNSKRNGKNHAMNYIISQTNSDVLILLDADIQLKDKYTLYKLIKPIIANNSDLTSSKIVELTPKSNFEKILNISMIVKKQIFSEINKGNNIYTCHGRSRAFSKKLYKSIIFKNDFVAEDAYSYLFAKSNNYKYRYVKESEIIYKLPGNFEDHKKQSIRFLQTIKQLESEFGKEFVEYAYEIPKNILVPISLLFVIKHPFLTFSYVTLFVYLKILSYFQHHKTIKWDQSQSSKVLVNNY